MARRGRPPKPLPERVPPLEQRIRLLCKLHGVPPTILGKNAGLDPDTVPGLIEAARKGGKEFPGSADTFMRLFLTYGRELSWFFQGSELPPDTWK